ncbi:DMT family transporter [Ensifer sp. NBAIM29]|uniref:EamA-like transporter family protein n=2 Tax=Sinorhizobium alkalisoli TaxID=1752398 RepID=A0A1E3VD30_9HYPH|nr:DMT family transporter [Ensifer sp. NBAIM29]MCG5479118.1 DMT family transporter [Sinorhizobium alkalisoli]ODR91489.1 EamA-like transporter family protein [Sinorhizobium alkalisoli]
MLLWALIVGASFPVVGLLSDGLPSLLLTAMRFAIAALAMLPMAWRAGPAVPNLEGGLLYAVMGLCLAGFFGVMFWAAHRVSAVSMSALFVSMPLLAYGLGRVFGVETRAHRLLAILVLGAVGALALALAQSGGDLAKLQFGWGEMAFFLGCIASALYPVLSKWGLGRGILSPDAAVRTFWSLAAGGVLIGLVGFIAEPVAAMGRMRLGDVLLVAYLGVFSSGATFWLMQRATGALTPGAVTAYSYLVPFVSMLVLFAMRPDVIGWQWLPGSLLVITAIALLFRGAAGQPRPQSRSTGSVDDERVACAGATLPEKHR